MLEGSEYIRQVFEFMKEESYAEEKEQITSKLSYIDQELEKLGMSLNGVCGLSPDNHDLFKIIPKYRTTYLSQVLKTAFNFTITDLIAPDFGVEGPSLTDYLSKMSRVNRQKYLNKMEEAIYNQFATSIQRFEDEPEGTIPALLRIKRSLFAALLKADEKTKKLDAELSPEINKFELYLADTDLAISERDDYRMIRALYKYTRHLVYGEALSPENSRIIDGLRESRPELIEKTGLLVKEYLHLQMLFNQGIFQSENQDAPPVNPDNEWFDRGIMDRLSSAFGIRVKYTEDEAPETIYV